MIETKYVVNGVEYTDLAEAEAASKKFEEEQAAKKDAALARKADVEVVQNAANAYLDLVNEHKLKAQEAREVLPLGTKTMLMHCAFKSDWLDFIKLRKSPAAHPDAYKLAAEVEKLLNNKI